MGKHVEREIEVPCFIPCRLRLSRAPLKGEELPTDVVPYYDIIESPAVLLEERGAMSVSSCCSRAVRVRPTLRSAFRTYTLRHLLQSSFVLDMFSIF